MNIDIITPVLDHPEFCDDYEAAVNGAHSIIVDTGSSDANRMRWMTIGHVVDYPARGHNYGHWCNAGYVHSSADIVIFLNNDVKPSGDWLAQVAEDVQDGALYGPELLSQHVDGVEVPFLSGWCLAGTRVTWDKLTPWREQDGFKHWDACGPWDTISYPAAGYWEDNDLCFRAVQLGIALQQVRWPIMHLDNGNGTSKHLQSYYADVKRNRATFEASVRRALYAAV